jgi:hypothetical protein
VYNPSPSLSISAQKQRLPIAKNKDDVSHHLFKIKNAGVVFYTF